MNFGQLKSLLLTGGAARGGTPAVAMLVAQGAESAGTTVPNFFVGFGVVGALVVSFYLFLDFLRSTTASNQAELKRIADGFQAELQRITDGNERALEGVSRAMGGVEKAVEMSVVKLSGVETRVDDLGLLVRALQERMSLMNPGKIVDVTPRGGELAKRDA